MTAEEKHQDCLCLFFSEDSDVMLKGTEGTQCTEHRNIIMLHTALYTQTTKKPNGTVTHNRVGGGRKKINMARSIVMPCNELVYVMLCYLAFSHYHCTSQVLAARTRFVNDFKAPEGKYKCMKLYCFPSFVGIIFIVF